MLKLYLLSVLMWMFIIVGVILCIQDKIIANGWLDGMEPSSPSEGFRTLLVVSAIPIFRLILCYTIIYMARETKEQCEEKYNDEDDD